MKTFFTFFFCFFIVHGVFPQNKSIDPDLETMTFVRVKEPNENAFSILVPKDWVTEGGIYRIDPTAGGGSGNAIDAKNDFAVKSSQSGEVMIRFLPDMFYFDMRKSPAGQMGMFPTGSNYNGMLVYPVLPADQFIQNIVIPYVHPQLADFTINESKGSPELIEMVTKEDQYMGIPFQYDAAVMDITYPENGVIYREFILAITQDFGQLGAGLWRNRHTFYLRTPTGQLEDHAPVFNVIINSVEINMQWFIGELRGQVERGEIGAEVLARVQELDKEIQQGHMKTNAEINNQMFLNLTGQEEYKNPHTNEIEMGSNQWNNRWINSDGEVIYTDDVNYNPNTDQLLKRDDYKLSTTKNPN